MLNDAKHTVIKMLIEVLYIGEGDIACRAHASNTDLVVAILDAGASSTSSASVGCGLLNSMYRGEMSLEYIGAVKALL